jgi:hypothetical protein
VQLDQLILGLTTKGNPILLICSAALGVTNTSTGDISIFRDGALISPEFLFYGNLQNTTIAYLDSPAAGYHYYQVMWHINQAASDHCFSLTNSRCFQAIELG